jgi:hypothetical protein
MLLCGEWSAGNNDNDERKNGYHDNLMAVRR